MQILKTIWAVLSARWFLSLLGVLLLSFLIWFFGDLLRLGDWLPFGSDVAKLVGILMTVFLWGASNLYSQRRARTANEQMVEAVSVAVAAPDPTAEETDEVGRRFRDALEALRNHRFKGKPGHRQQYLYELPWYVIIGPPGAGKSTLLANSGLHFPLGAGQALRSVAGTRHCDWFFTDEAVLIDTAGRYTTQDSREDVDHAAWQSLLDQLKTHRPRQPLNGILVAISLQDLLQGGEQGLIDHARAVKKRLLELGQVLGMRLPVYLMLTKADLIAGFVELFGDLDEAERRQVLGVTLPYEAAETGSFGDRFDRLLVRLGDEAAHRLPTVLDLSSRAAIYKFPAQVAALKPDLERFMTAAFTGHGLEETIKLRGLYLSSGVQQGLPIDRMMSVVSNTFGLATPAPLSANGERSFFLTKLLKDLVFAEAHLVGANAMEEKRRQRLLLGGYVGLGALALCLLSAWFVSYIGNRDRILTAEQNVRDYTRVIAELPTTTLEGEDRELGPVLPVMDRLRALPAGYDDLAMGEPWSLRFGLSQAGLLGDYGNVAYRHGLGRVLLPRVLLGEEQDLQASITDSSYVLPALKVYLMLGGLTEPDNELIRAWLHEGWQQRYPDAGESLSALGAHLDAFVDLNPNKRPELSQELVELARQTLNQVSVARRAYDGFRQSALALDLPAWRPVDHAGPDARAVFVRQSGRDIGAGLQGLYTHAAFHDVLLPSLPDIAKASAAESWVLGVDDEIDLDPSELKQLEKDILQLYEDDYIRLWDELLEDVTLAPLTDLDASAAMLNALAGQNSPLKLLLQAAVKETALTVQPEVDDQEKAGGGKSAAKLAGKALGKYAGMVRKNLKFAVRPAAGPFEQGPVPGAAVEAHFADLKAMVEGVDGAPPLLDQPVAALGSTRDLLQQVQLSTNPNEIELQAQLERLAAQLGAQASKLPEPIGGWLAGVAATTNEFSADAIRRQLNSRWRADVLPLCRTALNGRFPFSLASRVDVNTDDFIALFGPGGLIEAYVQTHLANFIDTARRPWRWRPGVDFSSHALAQFERADRIKRAMFAAGGAPAVRFTLEAEALGAAARSVSLDLDGQALTYAHGPSRRMTLNWPGPDGSNLVRLSFAPIESGRSAVIESAGAWSWFRLLKDGTVNSTALPDVFDVLFVAKGHDVAFKLRAGSVENPFDLRLFAQFQCADAL